MGRLRAMKTGFKTARKEIPKKKLYLKPMKKAGKRAANAQKKMDKIQAKIDKANVMLERVQKMGKFRRALRMMNPFRLFKPWSRGQAGIERRVLRLENRKATFAGTAERLQAEINHYHEQLARIDNTVAEIVGRVIPEAASLELNRADARLLKKWKALPEAQKMPIAQVLARLQAAKNQMEARIETLRERLGAEGGAEVAEAHPEPVEAEPAEAEHPKPAEHPK